MTAPGQRTLPAARTKGRLLRSLARFGGVLAVLLLGLGAATAQTQGGAPYPARAVRIIVPFQPGGSTDVMSRALSQKLSETWKQPVVVENRPGAGGMIGADAVARAPADGYTSLAATISHAVNVSLFPKAPYNFQRDLQPVVLMGRIPLAVVVRANAPLRSLKDLYAASLSGHVSGGSSGNGGAAHLALELFNAATGARIEHVPYKGGAGAMTDLIGGQIDVIFALLPEALPHLKSGRLRALAVTSDHRHPLLPDAPTAIEAGVGGIEISTWNALMMPAGTPRDVLTQVHADVSRITATAEMRARLVELGYQPVTMSLADTEAFVRSEVERWARVVQLADIRPD